MQALTHLRAKTVLCPSWCAHGRLQTNHILTKAGRFLTAHTAIVNVQPFVTMDEFVASHDADLAAC